jgi:hypothetical protein
MVACENRRFESRASDDGVARDPTIAGRDAPGAPRPVLFGRRTQRLFERLPEPPPRWPPPERERVLPVLLPPLRLREPPDRSPPEEERWLPPDEDRELPPDEERWLPPLPRFCRLPVERERPELPARSPREPDSDSSPAGRFISTFI